jgi:hypothetical protein
LSDNLRGLKVCVRVEKEIRELIERLPEIQRIEGDRGQAGFIKRKIELESRATPCRRGFPWK